MILAESECEVSAVPMQISPYTPEHEAFRRQVRRFVDEHVIPDLEDWERAGAIPRAVHRHAAEIGLLGIGYPSAWGGVDDTDLFYQIVAIEELARAGSGGVLASLMTHGIACPPILALGSDAQKRDFLAPVLRGERIAALAITEPSGGSDVANLRTRAVRDGDDYLITGEKTLITSGMRADQLTVAVRTGGDGMGGISLLVVETDRPGITRTPLEKMGWWCSDTASIHFDAVRVPLANRLGAENAGFMGIMMNFNGERIALAAQAWALAQVCYDEALAWARERQTFGKPLIRHQVIRHKLVDMRTRIEATRALLEQLCLRVEARQTPVAELCMLKNFATQTLEYVAGEAVQILGGAGYIRGAKCERIFRETKVLSIGGGATEVMKELAARQLGY